MSFDFSTDKLQLDSVWCAKELLWVSVSMSIKIGSWDVMEIELHRVTGIGVNWDNWNRVSFSDSKLQSISMKTIRSLTYTDIEIRALLSIKKSSCFKNSILLGNGQKNKKQKQNKITTKQTIAGRTEYNVRLME